MFKPDPVTQAAIRALKPSRPHPLFETLKQGRENARTALELFGKRAEVTTWKV